MNKMLGLAPTGAGAAADAAGDADRASGAGDEPEADLGEAIGHQAVALEHPHDHDHHGRQNI